jgi:Uma2 family endonuclease
MTMIIKNDPTRSARETLPTMYDLPSEEVGDAGMPDEYHARQSVLLDQTFRPPAIPADEVFSAIDMNLYYDARHPLWYKRPDWFGAINVSRLYEGRASRFSYVCWQEDAPPLIVIELLSPGTEKEDLGRRPRDPNEPPTKWEVYERILRVPYYAVFSGESAELRIFQSGGDRYEEVIGHNSRFWIEEAGLGLGLWQGSYRQQDRLWLRWFDAQGNWIPTADERADQERRRADNAERQAERLAELLRQLGHDPDQI